MKRPSWIGAPLAASALVHTALGLRLYMAPLEAPELERDTFVVRTVELAPPAPAPEPPREEPAPPPPDAAPPERSPATTAKPVTKPQPARPMPPEPAPVAMPEPATAPEALLAAGPPSASGGVVQVPGAAIATVSTSRLPLAAPLPPVFASPARGFTRLSDLSRKPRAPTLDAALRDNYPPEQRRRGVEGQAEVQVMIEGNGHVGEIQVLSESSAGFAEACRRTLRGSLWSEPLGRDGRPVRTRLTYRCRFRIER